MAVNVNTNVSAMTAQRYLNNANSAQQTSMERLASGSKINSAKDDAAGAKRLSHCTLRTEFMLVWNRYYQLARLWRKAHGY